MANPTTNVTSATQTLRRGTIAKNSLRASSRITKNTSEEPRVMISLVRISDSVASSRTDSSIPRTRMMTRNHQALRLRLPSAEPKITSRAAQAILGGAGTSTISMSIAHTLQAAGQGGEHRRDGAEDGDGQQ